MACPSQTHSHLGQPQEEWIYWALYQPYVLVVRGKYRKLA
jgi:hypothetical protein